MNTTLAKNGGGIRVEAVDLLRGIVLLLVALDFTRYYTLGGGEVDPMDLATTTAPLFFSRWITHFFVPGFMLLAGLAAFFREKDGMSKKQMSFFLFTRGLFVMALEILVVGFLWDFQPNILPVFLQFVWVLGLSMVVLAALIWLPLRVIAGISLLVIFGHNFFDSYNLGEGYWQNILWGVLHEETVVCVDICERAKDEVYYAYLSYPLMPWAAIMGLGYSLGGLYKLDPEKRKKLLLLFGGVAAGLFIVIRWINGYGNSEPWSGQDTTLWTVMSFLNVGKYPPSLSYVLMTVGPLLMLLALAEKVKSRVAGFFQTFGRAPLFFYLLCFLLAHTMALVLGVFQGFPPGKFLDGFWNFPQEFGVGLFWVYLLWITIVVLMYPICDWYADLRSRKSNLFFKYF